MGVCDFSCFITRGMQTIVTIDGEYGADHAVIVLVPKNIAINNNIENWSLSKFKDYKTIESKYSADTLQFASVDGYAYWCELMDYSPCTYMWYSSAYPDYVLVNFEKSAYNSLVIGSIDPQDVSSEFYENVADSRGIDYNGDKLKMYMSIVENWWD